MGESFATLIDALAELAAEDYLREQAGDDAAEAPDRAERAPLPALGEAA